MGRMGEGTRMTKTTYPQGFITRVEEWVNNAGPHVRRYLRNDTVKVIDVIEEGTDWAGDSFEGFHSEFRVSIQTDSGYVDVEGDDLASLWRYVMTGWGA